ncbi:uncharacterized protein JCM15063_003122 [Sporobolomyces koalae]|uniref:uncharacterized protein n=1 Tax=Sporobolomyces koalae TaxID=500713 RepID=UPI003173E0E9
MSSSSSSIIASATATLSSSDRASTSPASYKVIGVLLAVGSGIFIGGSFVLKKKGLLAAQNKSGKAAGEGLPYLKSWMWWTGMIIMILGELLNLVAYSFVDAILVTPLGAISVVVSNVLSHFFLNERLTTFGWLGSALCILGAVVIALNGPQEQTASTIKEFQKLFLSPGFLVWAGLVIVASLSLIFLVAPKYGKKHMLVYISICSLLGGLSVACTSGLGASILTSIRGDNQVKHWFFWFLLGFVVITLVSEVIYLNKALALFNTAMVTPTYFVLFTSATLVTSIILSKGFHIPATDIVTVVMGFLVICVGITLLQLSKIDPNEIKSQVLDRRSTVLLSASRAEASQHDGLDAREKGLDFEDPGIDTLRGTAGAIGSIHRAMSMRRGMSRASSRADSGFDPNEVMRRRNTGQGVRNGAPGALGSGPQEMGMNLLTRHQLYDEPMPYDANDKISLHSGIPSPGLPNPPRSATLKFAEEDRIHQYGARSGDEYHTTQIRADGSHMHLPPPVPDAGDLSAATFTSPPIPSPKSTDSETFTAARSGSVFATSAYADPYSARSDSSNDAVPGRFPRSPGQHKFPSSTTIQEEPSIGSDSRSGVNLVGANVTSPTRHRFALPAFARPRSRSRSRTTSDNTSHTNHAHRGSRPKGPADLEAIESEALVSGHEENHTDDEDEGDHELRTRLDKYDTRDQL